MSHRRSPLTCAVLCAGLLLAGCSSGGPDGSSTTTASHPGATARASAKARRAQAAKRRQRQARRRQRRRRQVAALGCPDPGRTLKGVYHPERLQVLDPCRKITGTVLLIRSEEEDGDLHFDVKLDRKYRSMLMANNYSQQEGGLVIEFMPRDYGHLPEPSVGNRVTLVGAYVDDTQHAWSELHPVWAVSINGRPAQRSGPQYGGSTPQARSDDALASCTTETGSPCTGYHGVTASRPSSGGGSNRAGGGGSRGGGSSGGGNCDPNYAGVCLDPNASDYDCKGGSGDGPKYVRGPVRIVGTDHFGLDSGGDGVGCE